MKLAPQAQLRTHSGGKDMSQVCHVENGSTAIEAAIQLPKTGLAGLKENWRIDATSGFILFLIALPLSLGIALASGVPPMAGIIAAIVGGLLVSRLSASHVTINGPAAGLIVIVLAAVERLGGGTQGYHYTLAAIVVSGLLLLTLGLLKAGELGYFFPSSVVHGMLAAIGFIIMLKQFPIMLGVIPPAKEPLMLAWKLPEIVLNTNPDVALIGFVSLFLLIAHNLIKVRFIKAIPAPIFVVTVGIILAEILKLDAKHSYSFAGHIYGIRPDKCLVVIPNNVLEGIAFPDFGKIGSSAFWISAISIALIQGIETLLSAAAVADKLDPCKRPVNLSRDVAAVGAGTIVSGAIGGLPMIAEIVRSTANVAAGARTSWSNFFHGLFLFVFVVSAATLIDKIPLSALAALLVVTGFRLASPRVFKQTYKIGSEQLLIFSVTILAVLATDLLVGVAVGILTKLILHIARGANPLTMFKADVEIVPTGDESYIARVKDVAIFTNYIGIKRALDKLPRGKQLVVDLAQTKLVDHTVMERLTQYGSEYTRAGGQFMLTGLSEHVSRSSHPFAARQLLVR